MRAKLRTVANKPKTRGLRVMSYNVLSESLARRSLYPTNGDAILWSERFPAIWEEVVAYSPDILFLQEVDEARLNEWAALLKREPLEMTYSYTAGPNKSHGLIVAIKDSSLEIIVEQGIDYDDMRLPPPQIRTQCCCQLWVVELVDWDIRLVIGTTHLYWHPDGDYERVRQALILMEAALSLQDEYGAMGIVLGGDFNSTPGSPAHELLEYGSLSEDALDVVRYSVRTRDFGLYEQSRPTLIRRGAVKKLREFADELDPPALTSCYGELRGEQAFTNWTDNFRDTLDYIFVSEQVKPKSVMVLPQPGHMGPEPSSLPRSRGGKGYPSDHLPIVANIQV